MVEVTSGPPSKWYCGMDTELLLVAWLYLMLAFKIDDAIIACGDVDVDDDDDDV